MFKTKVSQWLWSTAWKDDAKFSSPRYIKWQHEKKCISKPDWSEQELLMRLLLNIRTQVIKYATDATTMEMIRRWDIIIGTWNVRSMIPVEKLKGLNRVKKQSISVEKMSGCIRCVGTQECSECYDGMLLSVQQTNYNLLEKFPLQHHRHIKDPTIECSLEVKEYYPH